MLVYDSYRIIKGYMLSSTNLGQLAIAGKCMNRFEIRFVKEHHSFIIDLDRTYYAMGKVLLKRAKEP